MPFDRRRTNKPNFLMILLDFKLPSINHGLYNDRHINEGPGVIFIVMNVKPCEPKFCKTS